MAERLIFHVDVNSAFLSWEAARRVKNGLDDIRLIPSCIGGDPEKRTGVVLAKSIPAKKFGIKTGEPVAAALRKCPELYIAAPDFKLYSACSRAFKDICRKYAPAVEEFSIDECFLDMSGTELVYRDPIALAYKIKDEIKDSLGFTVNIGIGPNKLLAKMASDFEKPDRIHTLFHDMLAEKMWPLPVGELFSVGASAAKRLNSAHIHTIGELASADIFYLKRLFGEKMGRQLHEYANGIDDSPVKEQPDAPKGYSVSTTLETDVTDFERANKILLALTESVAARLRADGAKTGCISVSLRTNDFKNRSHQQKLEAPTDITNEIYGVAVRLFSELWSGHAPLRLIGLSLTGLSDDNSEQMSFFCDGESKESEKRLDRAVDAIRSRFGDDIIKRGSLCKTDMRVGKKYRRENEPD